MNVLIITQLLFFHEKEKNFKKLAFKNQIWDINWKTFKSLVLSKGSKK